NGVATYEFPDDVAWDHLFLDQPALSLVGKVDAVCFGTLGQRSASARKMIFTFLQATRPDALKIFDLNLRQHFYSTEIIENSLDIADVLKLNDDELARLAVMHSLHGDEGSLLGKLLKKFNLQLAVLTRGEGGSLLVSPTEVSNHDGYATDIVDTIGAGDSFTAATALGLLRKNSLPAINDHANRVAAFVCSQKGAMPVLPENLRQ
ncbi:MAG: PfkB family carbohydrate kinase, partial [Desulforhopalus sp.]